MKRILILLSVALISSGSSACPFCGCGVGNFYMGLLPNFKSKFVGLRYQYMQYHTQVAADPSQFGNDYFNTTELWGGFNIGSKWQVIGLIPYHFNNQVSDDGSHKQQGLGDITLLANYRVFQSTHFTDNNKTTQQQLWIGGGFKLPTGKNNTDVTSTDEIVADANSQSGTGSLDFILSAAYNVRINKFGVNTSINYKINTPNTNHYSYGNRFNATSLAYYILKSKSTTITPNMGLLYEQAAASKLTHEKLQYSGGFATFASAGMEFGFNKITLGINVQLPFAQNFANGQTDAKLRGMAHVSFSF